MKKKVLYLVPLLIGILSISCKQGPSLQQYFVEKMDDPSFLIVNLPLPLDSLFKKDLTPQEQALIKGVNKLNLLVHRKDTTNTAGYLNEVAQLKDILAASRYQHLMDFKAFDTAQGNLLFEGELDQIDEGIIFIEVEQFGFGVLRVLGTQINPGVLVGLGEKINEEQLKKNLEGTIGTLGAFLDRP